MNKNIQGKVVVITGAGSGLGEATARLLSSEGATVGLGARRVERLESLTREFESKGAMALTAATDVTERNQIRDLVDTAVQTFGLRRCADHQCRADAAVSVGTPPGR